MALDQNVPVGGRVIESISVHTVLVDFGVLEPHGHNPLTSAVGVTGVKLGDIILGVGGCNVANVVVVGHVVQANQVRLTATYHGSDTDGANPGNTNYTVAVAHLK